MIHKSTARALCIHTNFIFCTNPLDMRQYKLYSDSSNIAVYAVKSKLEFFGEWFGGESDALTKAFTKL